jgi:hypothetical protein
VGKSRAKPKFQASVVGADGRTPAPHSKVRVQLLKHYAVTSGPPHLLGVWHVQWATLEARLPGGRLCGSGLRRFGFKIQVDADRRWGDYLESEPVRHPRS